jgi:hypothetical protein
MVSDTFNGGLLAQHGIMGDAALYLDTLDVRNTWICLQKRAVRVVFKVGLANLIFSMWLHREARLSCPGLTVPRGVARVQDLQANVWIWALVMVLGIFALVLLMTASPFLALKAVATSMLR